MKDLKIAYSGDMKRRVCHRHPEEWRFSFKQRQRLFVRMLTNADGVI